MKRAQRKQVKSTTKSAKRSLCFLTVLFLCAIIWSGYAMHVRADAPVSEESILGKESVLEESILGEESVLEEESILGEESVLGGEEQYLKGQIEATLDYLAECYGADSLEELWEKAVCDKPENSNMQTLGETLHKLNPQVTPKEYGELLCDAYATADKERMAMATRLKFALICYRFAPEEADWAAEEVLAAKEEEQGIMSLVYALYLAEETGARTDDIRQKLLALQLPDGGFSLYKEKSDVDVTAMVLQALLPYREEHSETAKVIEEGLDFLASSCNADGTYSSMDVPNCESTAQVILLLAQLGPEYLEEERFTRNGRSLTEVLCGFANENGSFSHVPGQDKTSAGDEIATIQALSALVYVYRTQTQEFFTPDLDSVRDEADAKANDGLVTRLLITVLLTLVAAGGVAWVIHKRENVRNRLLSVAIIYVLVLAAVWFVKIQGVEEFYRSNEQAQALHPITVTVSISKEAVDSENPDIAAPTEVILEEGASAFDALLQVTTANRIPLEYQGSGTNGKMVYVEGIAHLYEFDYGDLSGWIFMVNGESARVGAAQYILSDGDTVEWVYSTKLGKDVENE